MSRIITLLTPLLLGAPKARDVIAQGSALGKVIQFELSAEGAKLARPIEEFRAFSAIHYGAGETWAAGPGFSISRLWRFAKPSVRRYSLMQARRAPQPVLPGRGPRCLRSQP